MKAHERRIDAGFEPNNKVARIATEQEVGYRLVHVKHRNGSAVVNTPSPQSAVFGTCKFTSILISLQIAFSLSNWKKT